MKLKPGDLVIDKNFNRTLTILDVKQEVYMSIGEHIVKYERIHYSASDEPLGKINIAWDYELDVWTNLELLRVKE